MSNNLANIYDKDDKLQNEIKAELEAIKAKKESNSPEQPVSSTTDIKEEQKVTESVASGDSEVSSVEAEARKAGWTSKEEWADAGKDPRLHKSAEQFTHDGSFFKKINDQKKDIDEMKSLLRQMTDHNLKVEKAAYEKARADLTKEKLQAVREGDVEKVLALEKQAEVLQQTAQQQVQAQIQPAQAPQPTIHELPEVKAFKARNASWIDGTSPVEKAMQAFADRRAREIGQSDPNVNIADAVSTIEAELQEAFPHKFENKEKSKPAMVGRSTVSNSGTANSAADKLSSQQKAFLKNAQRYGSKLTAEKYAEQLRLTGDLKDD